MPNISYDFTLSSGNTALASQVMANFANITSVVNGGLDYDNFDTLSGQVDFSIASSTAFLLSGSSSSTYGILSFTQNGVLASSRASLKVTSSAAQTAGDALALFELSSGSSTIPIIQAKDSSGEVLAALKGGTRFKRLKRAVANADSPVTAAATDDLILADCSSGNITVNLPAVASSSGMHVTVMKTDSSLANRVTIDGNSSETINGATTFVLCTQYEVAELYCNGSAWIVLRHDYPRGGNSYTPTSTWNSNVTVAGFWYRRGNKMRVVARCDVSASGASGNITFGLPSGAAADASKIPGTEDDASIVGTGVVKDSGSGNFGCAVIYNDTTTVYARYLKNFSGTQLYSDVSATDPFGTLASGDAVHVEFELPISGWEG